MSWWIETYVRPGMICVDLGANVGCIVKELQQYGGCVYAVEPDPALRSHLLDLTPHVLTLAMSDQDGETTLHLSGESQQNSLYLANTLGPGGRSAVVRSARFDSLMASGEIPVPIGAVKVDIQGAEAAMLRGAHKVLMEQRPVWWMEIWSDGLRNAGDSAALLCQTFEQAGYVPMNFLSCAEVAGYAERHNGHGSIDALFVPKERL